jgi:hypothetical protein
MTPDTYVICGTADCVNLGQLSGRVSCDANLDLELHFELYSQPGCTGSLLSVVDADNGTCMIADVYQISHSVRANCCTCTRQHDFSDWIGVVLRTY